MITFKEFLNESYKFSNINSVYWFVDESKTKYAVEFFYDDSKENVEIIFSANNTTYKRQDNTPNPVKVFRTIGDILDDNLKKHKVSTLEFTGDKLYASRIKLYDKLAKRIASKYNGKLEVTDPDNTRRVYKIKL